MQTKDTCWTGSSVSKAKARKQEQKTRTVNEKQAKAVVDSLKQETNLLSQFPSLGVYIKNGCNLEVKFCHASELTPAIHAWAYELCEQNMHSMYEDVWGWKPAEKQSELKHPDARYLLVHDADRSTVAYVHFRFEVEDATPVLYVYEVQLAPAVQRKGLGAFLMTLLKLVAKKSQLEAIMLTVLDVSNHVVHAFVLQCLIA
ncbi:N-alpha-acetyltransferase 40 [Trebouxia sp. C0009 RCD-2024]